MPGPVSATTTAQGSPAATPRRGGTVSVCVETGDPCAVVVADTGPGIPDADRERVFGRLVRLEQARDRDSGGAGLGLPLARALARAHGGDLVAEPAATGARFRLSLPVGEAQKGWG